MPSPVEHAVDTYIAVASEPDPAKRAAMLDACWAEDGRLVAHGGNTLNGRDKVRAMFDRVLGDPKIVRIRVLAKDARGTTFRFRYATDNADGTITEGFDVGEIDSSGRIALLIVFADPFVDG